MLMRADFTMLCLIIIYLLFMINKACFLLYYKLISYILLNQYILFLSYQDTDSIHNYCSLAKN